MIKPKAKTEKKKRISIAMTPSVHKMAQAHAERLNMSLSELIETLLIEEMSQ
jgi:predicted HicB family RNase H-like nuclease